MNNDDNYMGPDERPGEGSMLHQLAEMEKSHAVADSIARDLATALLGYMAAAGIPKPEEQSRALERYISVMHAPPGHTRRGW